MELTFTSENTTWNIPKMDFKTCVKEFLDFVKNPNWQKRFEAIHIQCSKNFKLSKQLFLSILISLFCSQVIAQNNLVITPLNLANQKKLKMQLLSIITELGNKRIVGLGEGTHGTKEFNDIRISIIKELISKKGFTKICFENPFGDSHYLNEIINSKQDIRDGLKKYAISIWQTEEIENFLLWLRAYNYSHKTKVEFTGIDFNYITNSAKIIKANIGSNNILSEKVNSLLLCTSYQDSLWEMQNDTAAKINFDDVLKNGFRGYQLVESIDSLIKANDISIDFLTKRALLNCKHGFDMLYYGKLQKEGTSRDRLMADIVSFNAIENPNPKIIVWAHAGHTAYKPVYKGDNGGGMGGFLRERFGNLYYTIGTTTANGTYSATKDGIDTRSNKFNSYTLTKPLDNSWEALFSKNTTETFFFPLDNRNVILSKLKWRPIGYLPETISNYTEEVLLSEYFDALIFIKNTTASNHNF